MRIATHLIVSFAIAASTAGLATSVSAQSGRDAAMQRCIQQAQAAFPRSGASDASQDTNRTASYKACMTRAGFTP